MTAPLPYLDILVPYALRRVPEDDFACLLPGPITPKAGDIALARLEKIGKNARLELVNGRPATMHEGDLLAVVFGNRYATEQFEGYASIEGDSCDLLSMGGLCGLVKSKHASVAEPTKICVLGAIGDADARPLWLNNYALAPALTSSMPRIVVVCGSSMDAGKTYTAMSVIRGLRKHGHRVAAMKLTGTATGRDTWSFADAGAYPALDFVDGGFSSSYLASLDDLHKLYRLLVSHCAAAGAEFIVVEVADGLFQRETAALLQSPVFVESVNSWLFATGDPLAADAGVRVLRSWGITPLAISGVISTSPLAMREAVTATGLQCLTAREIQAGKLNECLHSHEPEVPGLNGHAVTLQREVSRHCVSC